MARETVQTAGGLEALEARYGARDLPIGAEVVRIAPSPTGRPHIGTGLQGIINFALARQHGGVFILRIEDTDRKRLVPGAIEEIIEALQWLGVPPDEGVGYGGDYGPYLESERLDIYRTVVDWLVAQGSAYPCFCTPERLTALREQQTAAGQPPGYDRHCRRLTPEERQAHLDAGEVPAVRLAMPEEGIIAFDDLVRGRIEFNLAQQDDPVILKSDGFPTYHLAAMVDDHFMRVTTIVRGEEWISSTPKHLVLYLALSWDFPRIVHTPLLRDAQGRKLGKRFGDTSLAWFRTQGYLPAAIRNFLTRIIWPHPEGKDVYPFDDFIAHIHAADLPKTGPMVDLGLLDFICGEYLRALHAPELYDRVAEWLDWVLARDGNEVTLEVAEKRGRVPYTVTRAALEAYRAAFTADRAFSENVLRLEPERYRKLGDIVLQTQLYYAAIFTPAPTELLLKQVKGDAGLGVSLLRDHLALNNSTAPEDEWQASAYAMAERAGIKPGTLFMLLRVAITGAERTPPLYPIIRLLGPAEVRRRLEHALRGLDGA